MLFVEVKPIFSMECAFITNVCSLIYCVRPPQVLDYFDFLHEAELARSHAWHIFWAFGFQFPFHCWGGISLIFPNVRGQCGTTFLFFFSEGVVVVVKPSFECICIISFF